VILAHIMGIPIEESVLQFAPAGAAMVTAVAIAGRASLGRLRRRLRYRSPGEIASRRRMTRPPGADPSRIVEARR
jgi:hypothetical protein